MQTSGRWPDRLSGWIGDYLMRPIVGFAPPVAYSAAQLGAVLQPGDVLLVEGNLRFTVIKPPPAEDFDYTQVRWAS